MYKKITPKVVSAYVECPRKAFQLMFADDKGIPNEYTQSLEEDTDKNRRNYIATLKDKYPIANPTVPHKAQEIQKKVFETPLETEDFLASADILTKVGDSTSLRKLNYSHSLVIGTHKINKQQKIQLAFIGHILSMYQKEKPMSGVMIAMDGKSHKVNLAPFYKEVDLILEVLKQWRISPKQAPSVILNKHCSCCLFQKQCEKIARDSDCLSLLGGIGKKEVTAVRLNIDQAQLV